jgi:glycerophosphoryl diester phosphodiesterase
LLKQIRIRLFNGVAALFVPATLARRLGVDPESNPAALYALRLFGVRTVLIGAQLLLRDGGVRAHSLRVAPAVHALDATAALIAGERGLRVDVWTIDDEPAMRRLLGFGVDGIMTDRPDVLARVLQE